MWPPREGYFKVRAYSRGPWLPARIFRPLPLDPVTGEFIDRFPRLQADRDGTPVAVEEVWHWGREIDREEYEWLSKVVRPLTKI